MFRIGEFSKIAQVSGRLLRYYDEIGLLKPEYIDKWTSYRYYTANQLPQLNRILALKALGLSLEQIQQLLVEDVDTNHIRTLYLERKAEIERSLREELAQLQQVQLRLNQLDSHESAWMPDIIIKQVPAQSILSYREKTMTTERLYQLFDRFSETHSGWKDDKYKLGAIVTVLYSDIFTPEEDMDLEIGFLFQSKNVKSLSVLEGVTLTRQELPAVEQMATIAHQGLDDHPLTYNALGRWLEENQYRIVGPGREILIENYYPAEPDKCILEIQFPIEQADFADFNFSEVVQ